MITLISNHADLSTSGEKSSSLAMEKASCNLFLSLLIVDDGSKLQKD